MKLEEVAGDHMNALLQRYKTTRMKHDRTAVLQEAHRQRMRLMMINLDDVTPTTLTALDKLEKLIDSGHSSVMGLRFHALAEEAIKALRATS